MIRSQIPAGAMDVDAEPVLHAQMPAQDLGAKPAFETHDVIGLHRSPDRHCRLARLRWRRGGLSQTRKRPINTDNQLAVSGAFAPADDLALLSTQGTIITS
jgi:hypothetical protein